MEIVVKDINGKDTGRTVNLNDAVFQIEVNDHAIYLDVKHFLANQRQGTHKAKERAEVSGSTKKLKKQKGTGTARAGSIKSPVFVGGGRVFGPRPRDYSFKLNKKIKELARKSALTYKAKDQEITVIEDFQMDAPKTKAYIEILKSLSANGKKSLLLLPDYSKNVYLSSKNLQEASVLPCSEINTYSILKAEKLIITESSLAKLEKLLIK